MRFTRAKEAGHPDANLTGDCRISIFNGRNIRFKKMAKMPIQFLGDNVFIQFNIDTVVIDLFGFNNPVNVAGELFGKNVFNDHCGLTPLVFLPSSGTSLKAL